MSFGFLRKIITVAFFNVLPLLTFGAESLFVVGECPFVLCIVGCLAVSWDSTHWEPAASHPLGMTTKTVSYLDKCPWKVQNSFI